MNLPASARFAFAGLATGLSLILFASCRSLPLPEVHPWEGESPLPPSDTTNPPGPAKPPVTATDNSATDRRRVVPTQFSAVELIREKVKINGKDEFRMILRGDATIVHDKTTLKAPTIVLDPGNEGRLTGGVTVFDNEHGMVLHAAEGYYSRAKETVRLTGSPRFEIKQKDQKPILATTGEIHRDMATNITTLDGDLRLHGERWSLLADRGVYSDQTGILHLSSEPVLVGRDIFMSGGDMDYSTKDRIVILRQHPFARMSVFESTGESQEKKTGPRLDPELVRKAQSKTATPEELERLRLQYEAVQAGRDENQKNPGGNQSPRSAPPSPLKNLDPVLVKKVREKKATPAEIEQLRRQYEQSSGPEKADGSHEEPGTGEKAHPNPPTLYDISAERIEYRFGDDTEARLIGDVRITSKVRSIKGEEFRLSGPGLSVIETESPVQMVDQKERMEVKAGRMRYDTKKRWIWLSGKPVITMKEKNGPGIRAVLESAVIERDMDKQLIHARGNVHLKRRNEEVLAEIGIFREKEQTMDLFGRPYLYRNGTWMSCKRVRMLSNPDRVIFEEDVSGGQR